jgi:ribosomal protein RSM22 (predicted rRNA methylase)
MTVKELEQRIAALEKQVKQLQAERGAAPRAARHDWEAVVDRFKGDEHLLAVFAEAMKLRDKERRAIPRKRGGKSRVKP